MEFDSQNDFFKNSFDQSIDIREVLEKYLAHYKWFLLSIILLLTGTFLKLRYETPQYGITGSILIKENERGSSFSEVSTYEEIGLVGLGGNNLENEMQVLQSTRLLINVVKELRLNVQYINQESSYDLELFPDPPFSMNIVSGSSNIDDISGHFTVSMKSLTNFQLEDFDGNLVQNNAFGDEISVNLGNEENSNFQKIVLEVNKNRGKEWIGKSILVKIIPVKTEARRLLSRIEIEPVNERISSVITLSINDGNLKKGIAIINNLIYQYNADGTDEKVQQTQSTIDFLDLRIGLISSELNVIESTAEQFKTDKGVVNVNAGADLYLASSTSNQREIVQANTESQLISYMLSELEKVNDGSLLPGNIGLSDASIINKVSEYNELVLRRNRILKSSSTLNPIVVNIDSELEIFKMGLIQSLRSMQSSLEIKTQGLNRQRGQINSRIASVPKNEKTYKDIVREQETKNQLYLFLLQKREEAIVAGAANVTKAKIINEANSTGRYVSPNKLLNYFGAIFLGLVIPFIIIFMNDLLDTKIHDQNDLRRLNIPYIGDVPKIDSKNEHFISEGDNSNSAEAFRFIRTNINFLLDKNKNGTGRVVFITSTKANEGKTFTAINLASSLALSGQKVLLVAMDLRKPKIFKYLGLKNKIGVTNFIASHDLEVRNIINKSVLFDNLDICGSGDIPPNPVELLMSNRVGEIFNYSKENYDYLVVDTAPVGMVTDTMQIGKYADLTIYVIKSNYLDKRMLHIPKKMHDEGKLKNMAFLINSLPQTRKTYGYEYGYGNSKDETLLKRIKNIF